jgi:hypothetical protein
MGASLLATGLTLLFVAPVARAQPVHEHQPIPAEQLDEADRIFARAEALMATGEKAQWQEAAELFEQSARLRECQDPKILVALTEAASIASFFKDNRKAHRLTKTAAEHAMRVGDVAYAVEAYVRSVFLAVELGKRDLAVTYLARAQDLSYSPLLGAEAASLQALIAQSFGSGVGDR